VPTAQASPQPPLHPRFLKTGAEWGAATERGLGSLEVTNGTSRDAVAALFLANQPQRAIYVRAGETATLTGIAVGKYSIRFSLGLDWDMGTKKFTFDPSYKQFLDPEDYTEMHGNDGVTAKDVTVTLQPVVGGTARTAAIDAAQFDLSTLVLAGGRGGE
jgi:hypothetical protein